MSHPGPYPDQGGYQQGYGQLPAGGYPGYPGGSYPAPPPSNGSAIGLTIVSGLAFLSCIGLLALPSLIIGIIALTKNATDPAGSRKLTKTGWIVLAACMAITVVLAILYFVFVGGVMWFTAVTPST